MELLHVGAGRGPHRRQGHEPFGSALNEHVTDLRELHFDEGPLNGLKLIGFAIWERRNGRGRNVTFPARQYTVNGERRSFALLRPIVDATAQDKVRELILDAYQEHEEQVAVAS